MKARKALELPSNRELVKEVLDRCYSMGVGLNLMCEVAGVDPSIISHWKKVEGGVRPSFAIVEKIRTALLYLGGMATMNRSALHLPTSQDIRQEIVRRLKRAKVAMTPEELICVAGMDRQILARWESEFSSPTFRSIEKIDAALRRIGA